MSTSAGDVGVGLLDPVAEDVPETSGLGDLGDAVGDHPGLVAVAEPVEGQPGFDRFQPYWWAGAVEGAVHGRAQRSAAEVAAPVRLTGRGDEHKPLSVGVQVCAQQIGEEGGRVMVRADSVVLGGPSSIPRLHSIIAPTTGTITR